MRKYNVIITKRFLKQYKLLTPQIQAKVDKQLLHLAENLQHPSLKAHKMSNGHYWEARVDYHQRLVFQLEEQQITLVFVGTHQIYRKVA